MMYPGEFEREMRNIYESESSKSLKDAKAIYLMCEVLEGLGYEKGVERCEDCYKWEDDKGACLECGKPCKDCISKQAVFETIDDCNRDGLKGIFCSYDDGERFKEYIKELPSVTPTRKIGHWIITSYWYSNYCSNCNYKSDNRSNYCPNCGAEMKEIKMRLIDVDKLIHNLEKWSDIYPSIKKRNEDFIKILKNEDTVEKRRVGKWEKNEHTFWTCSECGLVNKYNRIQYAYCPNCGARMESEE